jgi:hypothetical protein
MKKWNVENPGRAKEAMSHVRSIAAPRSFWPAPHRALRVDRCHVEGRPREPQPRPGRESAQAQGAKSRQGAQGSEGAQGQGAPQEGGAEEEGREQRCW